MNSGETRCSEQITVVTIDRYVYCSLMSVPSTSWLTFLLSQPTAYWPSSESSQVWVPHPSVICKRLPAIPSTRRSKSEHTMGLNYQGTQCTPFYIISIYLSLYIYIRNVWKKTHSENVCKCAGYWLSSWRWWRRHHGTWLFVSGKQRRSLRSLSGNMGLYWVRFHFNSDRHDDSEYFSVLLHVSPIFKPLPYSIILRNWLWV